MKIGELAASTGVKAELIRYYERIGLINEAPRSSGNYRAYTHGDEERLIFIKNCRDLGFEIDDIRLLLSLQNDPREPGHGAAADTILAKIRSKSDALQKLEERLGQTITPDGSVKPSTKP